jgi:ribosomal protein L37AE/L43A
MPNKTCQTCHKFPAIRRVRSVNGKTHLWKCKTCLTKKQVAGFTKAKLNAA